MILKKTIRRKEIYIISYLLLGVLFLLSAAPLAAKENVKIKLPDGLYMYDSGISTREDGREWVGFRTFFVVQNNIIYSAQGALRKFGVPKLNKLFTEKKKYKILFGGEKIGEIYNVKIGKLNNELDWTYEEELSAKDIRQGPAYGRESIYLGRLGSAAKFIGVPEKYKEVKKKVYTTLPQEEVDKIAKLAKEKLLPLVINRKELKQFKVKDKELEAERIDLLDKISQGNDEMYIGNYRYVFRTAHYGVCEYEILFCAKKDKVHVITSNYDETLLDGEINICGMLDVNGDGAEELIIEKEFGGEDGSIINLEIYKQEADGNWMQIKKIKTRRMS